MSATVYRGDLEINGDLIEAWFKTGINNIGIYLKSYRQLFEKNWWRTKEKRTNRFRKTRTRKF